MKKLDYSISPEDCERAVDEFIRNGYKSPIELIANDIASSVAKRMDDNIYRAVVTYGVNVDKDELLKALKYDRDQYNKGFEDGAKEFAEKLITEKSYPHPNELNTRIVYVNDILEMLGEKR